MKISVLLTICALAASSSAQLNYIGGNKVDFISSNPALISKYMEQLTGSVTEACKSIPGIGPAVLSIRQAQAGINTLLDSTNSESYAKIILFKEFANKKTRQVIYKVVIWIKTFTSDVYLGAQMLYKPEGRPSFELISYIMDTDLSVVGRVIEEATIN